MPKIIIGLFILAVATIVWALQPAADQTEAMPGTSQAIASSPQGGTKTPQQAQGRRLAKERVSKGRTSKKSRRTTDIPRKSHRDLLHERQEYEKAGATAIGHASAIPKGAKINTPWPVATEGEFAVPNFVDYDKTPYTNYVRPKENSPFPNVATADFKDSVRRFAGGLPASGARPSRVLAADVLPTAIVTGLKLPPNTELKMLGPFNMKHEKVYENALSTADSGEVIFGVSYVTPAGEERRTYIRLEGEKTP